MSVNSDPNIVVCGSINMDLVVRCGSLPLVGETVAADSAREICGGKGANQAVAASKAGGSVQMIGRVGSDAFADRLSTNLREHHVGCGGVEFTEDCPSGLAVVTVEHSGQNSILLVAGANGKVFVDDVLAQRRAIASADVLLLQLEIPIETVVAAMQIAKEHGVRCVLDPAPVPNDWNDALLHVDLVCPNETEASAISGMEINSLADAEAAARNIHQRGARQVAITMGERGTVLLSGERVDHIEATKIEPVDTTAAGDAFAGALAVRWAETDDLLESVRFASVAGAIAATRAGAQPSLASREEIENYGSSE